MTSTIPAAPASPGFGARRKGPKAPPTLPLSAFSPPSSSASDRFPLPPSPTTVPAAAPIDAHVAGGVRAWAQQTGGALGGHPVKGVVLALSADEAASVPSQIADKQLDGTPVLAVIVPLGSPTPSSGAAVPTAYSTAYTGADAAELAAQVHAALHEGKTVEIAVQASLQDGGSAPWDALEDFLTKATEGAPSGKIVLTNILPPADDLTLPIVKLLSHSTYRAYQGHTAQLSLFSNLYLKFLPPAWQEPTPPTPPAAAAGGVGEEPAQDSKEKKEWKRRIKMYIGPALEAFGIERVLFGSSPAVGGSAAAAASNARDWYELARESWAEIGVEQDAIDAIFSSNALRVYGGSSA